MNVDRFVKALKDQEAELLEGLVTQPSDSLEKYREVVGRIRGLREALDIFAQNIADD